MTEELKPCPFCGGEAKIEIDEDGSAFITVEHEDCCYLDGVDTTRWFYACNGKSPAQVAEEAWNRRAERTCRWEHIEGTLFVTECGETYGRVVPDNYCPHCGAKVVKR